MTGMVGIKESIKRQVKIEGQQKKSQEWLRFPLGWQFSLVFSFCIFCGEWCLFSKIFVTWYCEKLQNLLYFQSQVIFVSFQDCHQSMVEIRQGDADTIIEKRNIPFLCLISTLFLDGLKGQVNDHAAFFSNYQIAIRERFYLHFLHGGDLQCGAIRMNGFYV